MAHKRKCTKKNKPVPCTDANEMTRKSIQMKKDKLAFAQKMREKLMAQYLQNINNNTNDAVPAGSPESVTPVNNN